MSVQSILRGSRLGREKKSIHSECHGIGYGEKKRKKNALNRMHKSRKFIIIAIITSNTRAFAFIVHLITAKTMAKPTPHSQASCNKGSYCKRAVKRKPCQRSTEIDCYVVSKIENDLRHAHTYNGGVQHCTSPDQFSNVQSFLMLPNAKLMAEKISMI